MIGNKKILMFIGGNAYPPNASGASTTLYNLLKGLDSSQLDVLTGQPVVTNSTSLPFQTARISRPVLSKLPLVWRLAVLEGIVRYIWVGLKLIPPGQYRRTLLVFPDTASIMAGYVVSLLRKLEFQVYLIDLLAESRLSKVEYILLKLLEKRLLRESHTVYCISRGVAEFYQNWVQREYVILPHGVVMDGHEGSVGRKSTRRDGVIAFAGNIHDISLDGLQNLVKAVKLIDELEITVQIYTDRRRSYLEETGLVDTFTNIEFIADLDELLDRLEQADILFSPVAFKPRYPHQAMTCFPTKTFDYVRANRPILVHAPANYFYTRYMQENQSALCVTSFKAEDLKAGILKLLKEKQLQADLVNNARMMVERHHDKQKIQERLIRNLFQS